MKDYLHLALKWISYNRGFAFAVIASLFLAGCAWFPPKAPSPSDPTKFITEPQLEAEKVAFLARYDASREVIEAQRNMLRGLADLVLSTAQNIPTPYSGIVSSALGIFTAGLGYDNIRKRSVIKRAKTKGA